MRGYARGSFVALICGVLLAGLAPSVAQAAFGVETFVATNCKAAFKKCASEEKALLGPEFPAYVTPVEPEIEESEKQGYTQAAGHVPFGVTDFIVNNDGKPYPNKVPDLSGGAVEHVRVDVAPGLATAPAAVPTCTPAEFGETEELPGLFPAPSCKPDTQIGIEQVTLYAGENGLGLGVSDLPVEGKVYNLLQPGPPHALASLFGVAVALPIPVTKAKLEAAFKEHPLTEPPTEPAKKETEEFLEKKQYYVHSFVKGNVEWGKEAAGTEKGDYHDYFEVEVSTALPLLSSRQILFGTAGEGNFITNGTACPGNHTTRVTLENQAKQVTEKLYETLIGLNGCASVPFNPGFGISPASFASDEPAAITAEASLERPEPSEEIDSSQVKTATFKLPEGMTLNPSAAAGLVACTPAQARIHSSTPGTSCPAASELGTVELVTPNLPPAAFETGHIYLGGPESGPITGSPYVIYVDAESPRYNVSVRLKAETIPNPATGQITTVFNENPEQPFTKLVMHFKQGALTPIASPLSCATASANGIFEPISFEPNTAPTLKNASTSFAVTGCPATLPFAPIQSTTNQTTAPGANTSFTFNLERPTGQQYLTKVSTTLPEGLAGKIPAAEQCSEAPANSETAECPAGSKIGVVQVEAGAGATPFTFNGNVYLTGPYNGAPFGMSIKVPAVAGPFNLGTQVTRATINVDPHTGRVTVASVLPTIRGGIPLRVRKLTVSINKQGFLINPTNCGVLQTESTLSGFTPETGATASAVASTPFQVANCSALGFTPTFVAKTSGKHSKANGASIETTLNYVAGQANVKSVLVQLPKQLPSRLTTLQKACLAATFETNPFSCPPGSFVGGARANTPLLPGKLTGPAILVSHAGAAFPDLDLVLEANGVRIIVVGNTDIKKGITTTNFATTPDTPVSSVTVNLPLGAHSALATEQLTTNLCTAKLVMPTTITAQNGKQLKQNTIIKPVGCGVQIVGHKVVGNMVVLKIKTFAAGRISGSGSGLKTVARNLKNANKAATLKVPLSNGGRNRGRPFSTSVRVGFVPKKPGAHSIAKVTVKFS
jgi:hypothetical protein